MIVLVWSRYQLSYSEGKFQNGCKAQLQAIRQQEVRESQGRHQRSQQEGHLEDPSRLRQGQRRQRRRQAAVIRERRPSRALAPGTVYISPGAISYPSTVLK